MSLTVDGPSDTEWYSLVDNNAQTIFAPTGQARTSIVQIGSTELNGGTQTLSIWVLQKSGATKYLRKLRAASAKERALIDELIVLRTGDVLKAQSSDPSGYFDISVTYLL